MRFDPKDKNRRQKADEYSEDEHQLYVENDDTWTILIALTAHYSMTSAS